MNEGIRKVFCNMEVLSIVRRIGCGDQTMSRQGEVAYLAHSQWV
jgi:hypothetical protein